VLNSFKAICAAQSKQAKPNQKGNFSAPLMKEGINRSRGTPYLDGDGRNDEKREPQSGSCAKRSCSEIPPGGVPNGSFATIHQRKITYRDNREGRTDHRQQAYKTERKTAQRPLDYLGFVKRRFGVHCVFGDPAVGGGELVASASRASWRFSISFNS
jgi:hypothetical protein